MQHPAIHRLFCGLVALSFPVIVHAQVTTAEISGTVRDSSSAVVPGAEVVMVNLGTGMSRTLTTDGRGRYEAPNLGLGTYEIVVAAPGFKTDVQSGISLNVGQRIVLNFTLEPGAVSEEITVARESPLVDTTSSQVGALVSRDQIRDLPLNGRDYTQLAMLQPGVVPYREQSKELNRGTGNRFSVSGARHNQVGFRLNGIDIADGVGATPGSATGNNLGVDAIQEFQVLTHTFSAEQGKSGGGIVNVVHKSGTNAFRGTAFEYLRNSALDARNFFDVSDEPPPFKRNQFGGTLGGPVIRNRTFFFGAYEGLRERLALTGINVVVTEAAKSGALGPVDERVQPYLDLMPSPNGRVFADGTGELVSEVKTRSDEDYVVGKVDHTFSSADSISMSYTFDDGRVTKPNPRDGIVTYNTISKNRFQYVTLEGTHIFTPNLLHTVRAGYNQSHVDAVREPLIDFPASLQFVPGVDFSSIEVSGIDPTAFVLSPEGILGNLGRNTLIGPGTSVVDFSVKRRFHLTASKLLESARRSSISSIVPTSESQKTRNAQ